MSDRRSLIVVDVETTGLDVDAHHVLEVAAVNVDTGDELYFVPALPVGALDNADGKALKLNGYFTRDVYAHRLSTAQSEKYWDQLWDWLDGNTLGGSNPTFDGAMINRAQQWNASKPGGREPSPWHHRLADLAAYAGSALHLGPHELVGLDKVCAALKVDNGSPHSALGDARATAECFRRLTEQYTATSVIGLAK
jgi:DNA polymerase-3 subunit epsilon